MFKKIYTKKNIKVTLIILYLFLFLIGFFFVKNALKQNNVDVKSKSEDKETTEVKPAVVYLIVEQNDIQKLNVRKRLENTNTVIDLLNIARKEDAFTYEVVDYMTRREIDFVFDIPKTDGYMYKVYQQDLAGNLIDITNNFSSHNLVDDTTIIIKQEPI